jgi:hypothetical protein
MRLISLATLLATMVVGSTAFAQGDQQHRYCRQSRDGATHCLYATWDQCMASKEAATESCFPKPDVK